MLLEAVLGLVLVHSQQVLSQIGKVEELGLPCYLIYSSLGE